MGEDINVTVTLHFLGVPWQTREDVWKLIADTVSEKLGDRVFSYRIEIEE
jgi:hypothetical protein